MKQLVEFPIEGGGTVIVEVDEPEPEGGLVRAARPGEIVARSSQTFQEAVDRARPTMETVSQVILTGLRALPDPPDEVTVMFGLKLHAEAGAFLASISSEAAFEVTLAWRRAPEVIVKPDPGGLVPDV